LPLALKSSGTVYQLGRPKKSVSVAENAATSELFDRDLFGREGVVGFDDIIILDAIF